MALYRTRYQARTALAVQRTGTVVVYTEWVRFGDAEQEGFWYVPGISGESGIVGWTIQEVPLEEGDGDDGDYDEGYAGWDEGYEYWDPRWDQVEEEEIDEESGAVDYPSSDEEDEDDEDYGDEDEGNEGDDEDEDEDSDEEDGGVPVSLSIFGPLSERLGN